MSEAPDPAATRRPDIAILMPSYVSGGAEAVGFFLAERCLDADLETDLVVARGHGGLKDRPLPGGRKIDLRAPTEFLALPYWLRYLGRENPRCALTLVHTSNLTGGAGAKFRPDVPVIATFHNSIIRAPQDQWWFRRVFGYGTERRLYKRMVRMTAVSRGLADEVAGVFHWPTEHVVHIANAPLTPADETAVIDQVHEVIFEKPVVLGVGRLAAQKDFATLIRAFAAAANRNGARDAHLLILGDGPQRGHLEALAADLGVADRVFLPGFVDNPARYMRRAAVFAISSRFEGFSLVCVEALASGVKIVSTDCKHGPSEILGAGAFGRLTAVGDATALGEALAASLAEGGDHAARRAERKAHLAQYEPDRMAAAYVDLIRDVLAETTLN